MKLETGSVESFEEKLRNEMRQRIYTAMANKITPKRIQEIWDECREIEENFFKTNTRNPKDIERIKTLDKELKQSSAMARNITEFRLLLNELKDMDPHINPSALEETLAHENAHANVAESKGYKLDCYILTFVGNEEDWYVQPAVLLHEDYSWSSGEVERKLIEVLQAPNAYGNSTSEDDELQIKKHIGRQKDKKDTG